MNGYACHRDMSDLVFRQSSDHQPVALGAEQSKNAQVGQKAIAS
jgi:hypothetical protein